MTIRTASFDAICFASSGFTLTCFFVAAFVLSIWS